ncbi:hypothetical protein [Streptomyces sp. CYG20]|uniref:hypothetical protein n=1 Tax=Streptomyces sp. CYG20 TaxID=2838873 RepID=UPI00203673BB|nr:hypothetical protein [Streptomyces sp. CYG20]
MLNAIDAVDWSALPGPALRYEPDRAAAGLRALATATGLVQGRRRRLVPGRWRARARPQR